MFPLDNCSNSINSLNRGVAMADVCSFVLDSLYGLTNLQIGLLSGLDKVLPYTFSLSLNKY